jgi:hypothetical protein
VALAKGDHERAELLWGAVSESRPAFLAAVAPGREIGFREASAIALGDETAHTVA